MKEIVSLLSKHSQIFEKFREVNLKDLDIKKKWIVYTGVDLNKYYTLVFVVNQKARFVQKDVDTLEDIVSKIIQAHNHNYKKRIVIIQNDLCSKAKDSLKTKHWRILRDSL